LVCIYEGVEAALLKHFARVPRFWYDKRTKLCYLSSNAYSVYEKNLSLSGFTFPHYIFSWKNDVEKDDKKLEKNSKILADILVS